MATPNATIAEVTSLVTKGTTPTTLGRAFTSQGIGFIKAECISSDGSLITEKQVYIDGDTDQLLKRSRLQKDDILFSIAGVIGRTALVHQDALPANTNQAIAILRPDTSKIIPRFLYYTVRAKEFQDHSLGHVVQTAQANVSLGVLSAAPIWLPPLPTQRRITGILSAYDELIDNSKRRIKILESMARALYREWFVHFRFPGHESVPLVPSTLGEIPEGWEVGRLDDVLVLQRGFDLPKVNRVEGHVPIYAATGVTGFHNEAKAKAPGVVTGRSGTIGDVIYVQDDFWPLNTALWAKQFPKAKPLYAFYFLSSIDLKQFNSGAAVPTLNRNDIHGLDALIPPYPVQQKFQDLAGEMLEQARKLSLQLHNLRRTRDLLLPRLLSGQIDVDAMPA